MDAPRCLYVFGQSLRANAISARLIVLARHAISMRLTVLMRHAISTRVIVTRRHGARPSVTRHAVNPTDTLKSGALYVLLWPSKSFASSSSVRLVAGKTSIRFDSKEERRRRWHHAGGR